MSSEKETSCAAQNAVMSSRIPGANATVTSTSTSTQHQDLQSENSPSYSSLDSTHHQQHSDPSAAITSSKDITDKPQASNDSEMSTVASLESVADKTVDSSVSTNLTSYPDPSPSTTTSAPPSRSISPRRDNDAIEQIGREKVTVLRKEAQLMQDNLGVILGRISQVKEDYYRLANENKFLQDYIGNLMSTSNITSS